MSVLIKDMEYPQNCGECKLSYNGICVANIGRKVTVDSICPLIEVPDHGRLIDADRLKRNIYANLPVAVQDLCPGFCNIVDMQKTVIESEGE